MSQQSKPSWPDETTTSNLSQKYPSTQLLRSSLSSTPHYGAGGGTNKESGVSLDHPYHHHETTSGEEKTVDFAEAARQRQQLYTSKVDFCARDVIACINCDGDSDGGATMTTINSNRKQGPVLLELRRISVVQNDANKLFATRPICVSRSNPSLGTSLSSTCLQVAPSSISSLTDATLPPCATGLTTGALCIHAFTSHDDPTSSSSSSSSWTPTIEYFHTPRHHRPSTAVAWRPTTSQVAIGLVGSSSTGGASSSSQAHSSRRGPAAVGPGSGRASSSSSSAGGGDKDFCCFIWDVEHQVSTAAATTTAAAGRRTKSTPIYKLAHQTGVASLSWVLEGGQLLALGAQMRNLQLFDLRIKTTGPQQAPLSVYAHNFGVHGVETDPSRPWQLASFCRAANEPVKIWDARRMDTVVSEIKISGMESASSSSGGGDFQTASVSTVKWSALEPGRLAVAVGDAVYDYDLSSSRPTHVNTIYANEPMVDICLYPYNKLDSNMLSKATSDEAIISAFFPKRLVAVYNDRTVHDVARHTLAPVAISRRDGRVVHAFGRTLFVGSTSIGPSAMERLEIDPMEEDISATMMRRARCQHVARYSMDTTSNIKILAEDGILAEQSANKRSSPIRDALLRLWSWIERVESLCSDADELWGGDVGPGWPAKGLIDAGAKRLLQTFQMDREEQVYSESLACVTYESAGRRAALTSCGWAGKFNLINVLGECEDLGEFERSAALAIWHGDIGAAVEAYERGAAFIRRRLSDGRRKKDHIFSQQYAETLELVSLCVAGYRGGEAGSSSSHVWRRACANLLQREDLSSSNSSGRIAYVRSVLKFLMVLGSESINYHEVLADTNLSLCDRVGFACRFLPLDELYNFMDRCVEMCQVSGDVEGVTVTGIEKEGIKILQSYVDRYVDVQTAALVTSRVIFPSDWAYERNVAMEWLDSYRYLLNTWQMWQSRAMFDVDRAELLRKIKSQSGGSQSTSSTSKATIGSMQPGRRMLSGGVSSRKPSSRQQPDPDVQAAIPAQLDARCNYCQSPLGLKSQDTHASQWLSKMKPVLPCCPQCRKPLPRCAICMLSLGALNPYMELTKLPRGGGGSGGPSQPDDLSSLANLPFAEWFTWCMRCKHGGHAHHLVGWFAKHDVCPVSGCDCQCQFDGIQKLNRPALSKRKEKETA